MKHMKTLYVLLLTVLLFSCSEDGVEVLGTGTITGTVIEEATGDPVKNAKISTSPATSTVFTDRDGEFILENVTVDDYSVQAEFDGFLTAFESVTVTLNNSSNVAFELTTSATNNTPPEIPELIFPEDEATDISLEVDFMWSSSDINSDDLLYTLQLRNGTTDEIRLFEEIEDTIQTVSGLQLGTNYFWQITVTDGIGEPVSSLISEFSTLDSPDNPFLFVRKVNGNNVIFSGNESPEDNDEDVDVNVLQITDANFNSFRPRRNTTVNKIAFLRTVGGNTHIFTMNEDGSEVNQVTNDIPVAGFRQDELDFTWSQNGNRLLYANFDKVYRINLDGSGANNVIYETGNPGIFVSEIHEFESNSQLLLLKTNNAEGYEVRVFAYNRTIQDEEFVVVGPGSARIRDGAVSGIDVSPSGGEVLFAEDELENMSPSYRVLRSRIWIYVVATASYARVDTGALNGENDLDPRYDPTGAEIIFTRTPNTNNSPKNVYKTLQGGTELSKKLFTEASMPDWE